MGLPDRSFLVRPGSTKPPKNQRKHFPSGHQIARNRQIDILRKESRPLPEELAEDPGAEPDAGQMLAIDQEAGKLRQALLQLKGDQRDMIEKAYMGEMTHQEISNQTGLPLGTIKSRIRLGLERLRYELKEMR